MITAETTEMQYFIHVKVNFAKKFDSSLFPQTFSYKSGRLWEVVAYERLLI